MICVGHNLRTALDSRKYVQEAIPWAREGKKCELGYASVLLCFPASLPSTIHGLHICPLMIPRLCSPDRSQSGGGGGRGDGRAGRPEPHGRQAEGVAAGAQGAPGASHAAAGARPCREPAGLSAILLELPECFATYLAWDLLSVDLQYPMFFWMGLGLLEGSGGKI